MTKGTALNVHTLGPARKKMSLAKSGHAQRVEFVYSKLARIVGIEDTVFYHTAHTAEPHRIPVAKTVQVEICAESLEGAMAAFEGGAHRVELCSDLSLDGLTPCIEVLLAVKEAIPIPVTAMVRPKAGGFIPGNDGLKYIEDDLEAVLNAGADGVVLGVLNAAGRVDQEAVAYLVEKAKGAPVTFHKAFDQIPNQKEGLETLILCGVERVLTAGGKESALAGAEQIAALVAQARDRITVIPGGGVRANHARDLALQTGASCLHSGLDRKPTTTTVQQFVNCF